MLNRWLHAPSRGSCCLLYRHRLCRVGPRRAPDQADACRGLRGDAFLQRRRDAAVSQKLQIQRMLKVKLGASGGDAKCGKEGGAARCCGSQGNVRQGTCIFMRMQQGKTAQIRRERSVRVCARPLAWAAWAVCEGQRNMQGWIKGGMEPGRIYPLGPDSCPVLGCGMPQVCSWSFTFPIEGRPVAKGDLRPLRCVMGVEARRMAEARAMLDHMVGNVMAEGPAAAGKAAAGKAGPAGAPQGGKDSKGKAAAGGSGGGKEQGGKKGGKGKA